MTDYYVLLGYLVNIHHETKSSDKTRKTKRGFCSATKTSKGELPEECILLDLPSGAKLLLVIDDRNYGHFIIKASTREDAYSLADLMRAYYGIFYGYMPWEIDDEFYLQEIKTMPDSMTIEKLTGSLRMIGKHETDCIQGKLGGGIGISYSTLEQLREFIFGIHNKYSLLAALNLLLESRFHICGSLGPGYYESHYISEHEEMPAWVFEKRYFENRHKYETAFIAAFKGIEAFFDVTQLKFKKREIEKHFAKFHHDGIAEDTPYERRNEIYSSKGKLVEKRTTYRKLLKYFLDIRNSAAAHSNKTPPEDFRITEETIFEIQNFLLELICKAISNYI